MTSRFLHDHSTAVECLDFITLADDNPSRAKHDLIAESVDNIPDTKLANDRNFLSPRFLDKSVGEQLATRVVNVIPSTLIKWERCVGFLTHWLVGASLMHAAER